MKDTGIQKKYGIPISTLQTWKNTEPDNWRYKIYTGLKKQGEGMGELNNDNRFDIDLGYGQIFEAKLADAFNNSRIEVKTERDIWASTGNIFIEFESRGKPSGLAVTEAEYYAFFLSHSKPIPRADVVIMVRTEHLKSYCRKILEDRGPVKGGDDKTSLGVLLKISEIQNLAKH